MEKEKMARHNESAEDIFNRLERPESLGDELVGNHGTDMTPTKRADYNKADASRDVHAWMREADEKNEAA